MLWIIITIIFGMLVLVGIDDYEGREREKDKEKWKEITGGM